MGRRAPVSMAFFTFRWIVWKKSIFLHKHKFLMHLMNTKRWGKCDFRVPSAVLELTSSHEKWPSNTPDFPFFDLDPPLPCKRRGWIRTIFWEHFYSGFRKCAPHVVHQFEFFRKNPPTTGYPEILTNSQTDLWAAISFLGADILDWGHLRPRNHTRFFIHTIRQ